MQRRVPDVRLAALCVTAAALLLFGFASPTAAFAEMLNGNIGASAEWGSSWMDFGQAANFIPGEKLKITLKRGGAQRVLVRLLPYGTSRLLKKSLPICRDVIPWSGDGGGDARRRRDLWQAFQLYRP